VRNRINSLNDTYIYHFGEHIVGTGYIKINIFQVCTTFDKLTVIVLLLMLLSAHNCFDISVQPKKPIQNIAKMSRISGKPKLFYETEYDADNVREKCG